MNSSRSIVSITVIVLAIATTTLFAHMKATKSEPAADATLTSPPSRVQVWFSQAPDPKLSKLEVTGPAGAVKLTGFEVTSQKAMLANVDGSLGDGRYAVAWQSAGDDGHIQKGKFAFTVKRAH